MTGLPRFRSLPEATMEPQGSGVNFNSSRYKLALASQPLDDEPIGSEAEDADTLPASDQNSARNIFKPQQEKCEHIIWS